MRDFVRVLSCVYFLVQASVCFSKDTINILVLPDYINCHDHYGFELGTSENSTLGILGSFKCNSDRPTYGGSNSKVSTAFSRIFVPWRYSFDGAFRDGYFVQAMVGRESSEFKSVAGSSADVTFIDLTFHGGYQWFWGNGFNVSALGGVAYLKKTSLDKNIVPGEGGDVVDFLDTNTDTNAHFGLGVIFGWVF
ncbi:MAG: hypothetical protein QNK31_10875 [Porticoccus sp.]|nr:hypothetical protein [Porticoccus sp.]